MISLARTGFLLASEDVAEAITKIEPARGLAEDLSGDYEEDKLAEQQWLVDQVRQLNHLAQPTVLSRKTLESLAQSFGHLGGYRARDPRGLDASLRDRLAGRRPLQIPPTGLDRALFSLYTRAGNWDGILALASNSVYDGAYIYKAAALTQKGLADAARVVYDDAIREGTKKDAPWRHVARYAKAELLVDTGDIRAARRELARLYADCPNWQDYRGLTERLSLDPPSGWLGEVDLVGLAS
jgi:hypothetical protein